MSTDKEIIARLMAYAAEQRAEAKRLASLAKSLAERRPGLMCPPLGDEPIATTTMVAFKHARDAFDSAWERQVQAHATRAQGAAKRAKAAASLAKRPGQVAALVEAYALFADGRTEIGSTKLRANLGSRGLLWSTAGDRLRGTGYSSTTLGREIAMAIAGEEPACAK